jgi:uncharacterized membrane protein
MFTIDRIYGLFVHLQSGAKTSRLCLNSNTNMRALSLILLVAGWFLVVAAIAMLKPGFVPVFVVAGLAVELLGLGLLARTQAATPPPAISRQERRG